MQDERDLEVRGHPAAASDVRLRLAIRAGWRPARTPVEPVQQIHAAFGRGDVPFIPSRLADAVEWEHATFPSPVPRLQPLKGRDRVPRFFRALGESIEFHAFTPTKVLGDAATGVLLADLEATVRSTGKHVVDVDDVLVWHFDGGVEGVRSRHRADTRLRAMGLQGD